MVSAFPFKNPRSWFFVVLGLSVPSLALQKLCWWGGCRDSGSILLPSLLLGLALGTHHRCNFKGCKMTVLTAMRRTESGEWKRERRDLGAASSKKSRLKRTREEETNSAECSEHGAGKVLGFSKEGKGEFSGSGKQNPLGCARNSSD